MGLQVGKNRLHFNPRVINARSNSNISTANSITKIDAINRSRVKYVIKTRDEFRII